MIVSAVITQTNCCFLFKKKEKKEKRKESTQEESLVGSHVRARVRAPLFKDQRYQITSWGVFFSAGAYTAKSRGHTETREHNGGNRAMRSKIETDSFANTAQVEMTVHDGRRKNGAHPSGCNPLAAH